MDLIYHLIYDIYNKNSDIEVYIFFCILSIFEINKNNSEFDKSFKIYFHYSYLPLENGKLWALLQTKLGEKLILKKIEINEIIKYKNKKINSVENKDSNIDFKEELIKNILSEYGGIYVKNNCLLLGKITDDLSDINDITCEIIQTPCITSYKKSIQYVDYFRTDDKDIVFKEIYDYSFSTYFYILRTANIIYFDIEYDEFKNINMYDVFNKTTIYNLLIRHIITYSEMTPSYDTHLNLNRTDFNMINNIDIILWINLDSSKDRARNMIDILSNFNISNQRIEAIDGSRKKDISRNYFECIDSDYPQYSNKEYAILATHLKAIETYSNMSLDLVKHGIALICEDDLSLDFSKYWHKDIKSVVDSAPTDWEIIMLGYFSLNVNRPSSISDWANEWSAIAYLVRYENLGDKIESLKSDIDSKTNRRWKCTKHDLMVSDNYIFSKFKTYVYKYPYFTFPNDNDSTFHEDHLNYHRIYKQSNYITLEGLYDMYV
jgi:hypothetical protein